MRVYKCRVIVRGFAEGNPLISNKPINLLTIDENGFINDFTSSLKGLSVSNKVLIFPNAVGSSVGAYRLYALKTNNKAPKAIVCTKNTDIITASAAALADIPLVDKVENYKNMLSVMNENKVVKVDAYKGLIQILD